MKIESQGLSLNGYVIVVEDDLTLRRVLSDNLGELAGQVCDFDNADDALVHLLASHGEFSLVIADHGVPGTLKGLEFIQMVREKWPHIHTVLTSGFQADGIGDVQPMAFLFKPWTVEDRGVTSDACLGMADDCGGLHRTSRITHLVRCCSVRRTRPAWPSGCFKFGRRGHIGIVDFGRWTHPV